MEVSGSLKKRTKEKLPHDLVIEILSWLHLKHLWPLRFVSKAWFLLLTKDSQFAKLQFDRFKDSRPDPSILGRLHTVRNANDSKLILATEFTSCDKAFRLDFPFYQPTDTYRLSGISNGLLCISPAPREDEVYIWNPLINDHITVSCLPPPSIRFHGYETKLTKFGFGFDQVSNVYKVVRIFTETDFDEDLDGEYDSRSQVCVYMIGVDSMFRTVEVDIPHALAHKWRITPLVNGIFHWLKNRPGTNSRDLIVTFDLKEEVIGEFMLPHWIKFDEIVELGGLLCAIDRSSHEQHTHMWVMKEYGEVSSWSKQYVIVKTERYMSTLGVSHNGEIIQGDTSGNLLLCNPETNTMKELKRFRFKVLIAYAFLRSIISPTAISQGGHNLLEKKS